MKLFVVIGGYDYEGYSEPAGIYSTREKADAAVEHAGKGHYYDDIDVLEYELDVGELEQESPSAAHGESK